MKTPASTLASLRESVAYHEGCLAHIRFVQQLLGLPFDGAVYEAYIQATAPNQRPIMAEGVDLVTVCSNAQRLDLEYNKRAGRHIELFVRKGELRVAILPDDARLMLPEDDRREFLFCLDSRILDAKPRNLVFRVGGVAGDANVFPSAWYAGNPTPERESALVDA